MTYGFQILFLVFGNGIILIDAGSLPTLSTPKAKVAVSLVSPNVTDTRIIGGEETTIEEHPHQVSFLAPVEGGGNAFCGGFIISENYILTAAHCCVDFTNPAAIIIRVGSTFRNNGTRIPLASVTPHPEYNVQPFDKDVCVLKTVSPIEFNEAIQPVGLPNIGRPLVPRSDVSVSGWGKLDEDDTTIPLHLYAVVVPVVERWKCLATYYTYLTENMFCVGNFFLGGIGSCQGDSGGAAVQEGKAVGIVSFARGCGKPLSPSVFTDIAAPAVRGFIKAQTGL